MPNGEVLHASAVAFGPQGLLIRGASGSGKSTLALQLIGLGATLVADDGVVCQVVDGVLRLSAPGATHGRIEARGLGILAAPAAQAVARGVIDMDTIGTTRLPAPRETTVFGIALPAIAKVESPAFPVMVRLWLEGGLTE